MKKKLIKNKEEALLVTRFIQEVLVNQLGIPYKNIVNDKTFAKYTMLKRADLLISDIPYDLLVNNEDDFIENLIAYAEVKDKCVVGGKEWEDAYKQGMDKAKMLKIPYFIVTNCRSTFFYNAETGKEIKLNGNPIRSFPDIDIIHLILDRLKRNRVAENISTSFETQSKLSEGVFNAKLWDLADIYRQVDFKNTSEKIDFTIGMIALKYFEEKEEQLGKKLSNKSYWSSLVHKDKDDEFLAVFKSYIERLERETEFAEFKLLMQVCYNKIGEFDISFIKQIYSIVESLGHLHGCGFDLFGAVYEMFASNKEKSDFGEFFTRRHYTKIFSKLLLANEKYYNCQKEFKILDPACGTGGFLTEAFKVLENQYKDSGTIGKESLDFLQKRCFYGIDIKEENISRTKLNMFLVGDGHTHIVKEDSLKIEVEEITGVQQDVLKRLGWSKFQYILSNPPYGNSPVYAQSRLFLSSRYEVAFALKIIDILEIGGKACIILPDGCLENPTMEGFRREMLQLCKIEAIISLPKFAFAPYTKEKTYAVFLCKKDRNDTKVQKDAIWMYIIDNDGYANSDKRFPTKLKEKNGKWLHDEISSYFNVETSEEELGLLEERWMKYDDMATGGTESLTIKGERKRLRKGGFIRIDCKKASSEYYNLLPEYHLRKEEPDYITVDDVEKELHRIKNITI